MTEPVDMPSTMWTVIQQARRLGNQALDGLFRKYRPPVLAFIRNAGFKPEEAEDLAQEVFLTLIRDDVLSKADRGRGRFRSLLLAVTRHAMSARRRYDGRAKRDVSATVPLDGELGDADARDPTFDHFWVQNVTRIAMNRLREECEKDGTPYFRALFMFANDGAAYDDIARNLGASLNDVRNYIHQARLRLKRFVLKEVEAYSSSRAEYEAEVDCLLKLLGEPK